MSMKGGASLFALRPLSELTAEKESITVDSRAPSSIAAGDSHGDSMRRSSTSPKSTTRRSTSRAGSGGGHHHRSSSRRRHKQHRQSSRHRHGREHHRHRSSSRHRSKSGRSGKGVEDSDAQSVVDGGHTNFGLTVNDEVDVHMPPGDLLSTEIVLPATHRHHHTGTTKSTKSSVGAPTVPPSANSSANNGNSHHNFMHHHHSNTLPGNLGLVTSSSGGSVTNGRQRDSNDDNDTPFSGSDEKRMSTRFSKSERRSSRRLMPPSPSSQSQLHHHHHHHDFLYTPLPPTSGAASAAASYYGGDDAASGIGVDVDLNSSSSSSYRKRFAKSLCSVLLVAAVLLVIFAVLGIVAVAVYLGMLTNDPEFEKYMAQFQGGFNVVDGDRYGRNLSNPESEEFRRKSEYYRSLLSDVFKSSILGPGFHHVKVEGFRNGSDHFRVFFKVHLDRRKISHAIDDLTKAVHEVMSQEVMSLKPVAFKDISVDIDSILVERIRRRSDDFHSQSDDGENGIFQKVIAGPPSTGIITKNKLSSASEKEINENDITVDSVAISHNLPSGLVPVSVTPSAGLGQSTTYSPIITVGGWTPPASNYESGFHPSLYFPKPPFRGQIPPRPVAVRGQGSVSVSGGHGASVAGGTTPKSAITPPLMPNRDIPLAVRPADDEEFSKYAANFQHVGPPMAALNHNRRPGAGSNGNSNHRNPPFHKQLGARPPNIPVTPRPQQKLAHGANKFPQAPVNVNQAFTLIPRPTINKPPPPPTSRPPITQIAIGTTQGTSNLPAGALRRHPHRNQLQGQLQGQLPPELVPEMLRPGRPGHGSPPGLKPHQLHQQGLHLANQHGNQENGQGSRKEASTTPPPLVQGFFRPHARPTVDLPFIPTAGVNSGGGRTPYGLAQDRRFLVNNNNNRQQGLHPFRPHQPQGGGRPNMPQNRILNRYGEVQPGDSDADGSLNSALISEPEEKIHNILVGSGFSFNGADDGKNPSGLVSVKIPPEKSVSSVGTGIIVTDSSGPADEDVPELSTPDDQDAPPALPEITPPEPDREEPEENPKPQEDNPPEEYYYYADYPEEEAPAEEENAEDLEQMKVAEERPEQTSSTTESTPWQPSSRPKPWASTPRPDAQFGSLFDTLLTQLQGYFGLAHGKGNSEKSREEAGSEIREPSVLQEQEEQEPEVGSTRKPMEMTRPPLPTSTTEPSSTRKSVTFSVSSEERHGGQDNQHVTSTEAHSKNKVPPHVAALPYDPEIIRDLFGLDKSGKKEDSRKTTTTTTTSRPKTTATERPASLRKDRPGNGNEEVHSQLPPQKSYISGVLGSPPPPFWTTTPAIILPDPSPTSYSGFRESLRPLPAVGTTLGELERGNSPRPESELDEDWLQFFTTPRPDHGMKLVTLSKVGGIRYHKRLDGVNDSVLLTGGPEATKPPLDNKAPEKEAAETTTTSSSITTSPQSSETSKASAAENTTIEVTTPMIPVAVTVSIVTVTKSESTPREEVSVPGQVTNIKHLAADHGASKVIVTSSKSKVTGGSVQVVSTVLGLHSQSDTPAKIESTKTGQDKVFVVHSQPAVFVDSQVSSSPEVLPKPTSMEKAPRVIKISRLPPTVRVVQSSSREQEIKGDTKDFASDLERFPHIVESNKDQEIQEDGIDSPGDLNGFFSLLESNKDQPVEEEEENFDLDGLLHVINSNKPQAITENHRESKSFLSDFAKIRVASDSTLHNVRNTKKNSTVDGSSNAKPVRQLGNVFEKWFGNGFSWPQAIPSLFQGSVKNVTAQPSVVQSAVTKGLSIATSAESTTVVPTTTAPLLNGKPVKPIVLKENQSIIDLLDEIFDNKTIEEVRDQGVDSDPLPTILMEPKEEATLIVRPTTSSLPDGTDATPTAQENMDWIDELLGTTVENATETTAATPLNNTVVSMVTSVFPAAGPSVVGNASDPATGCREGEHFFCHSGDECVSIHSRCNQMRDCSDYSDETACTCADYLRAQFLTRKICDGVPDCWDFSDEEGCDWCKEQKEGKEMYNCQESQSCIPQQKVCDGTADCPFGDDESRCVTVSPSMHEADNPVYHSRGFLMVRKSGSWGKLCLNNFENVVRDADTHWDITDLGRAACKALTYQDFELVERRIDSGFTDAAVSNLTPTLRTSEPKSYYQLFFGEEGAGNKTEPRIERSMVVRGSLTYTESKCPKKDVLWVQCGSLKCGRRYGASSPKPHGPQARIVGGANSRGGAWPWIAALYKEGVYQCGGTLVSPQWLISAGHCFYHATEQYWVARMGALRRGTSLASPFEQLRHITHIILHPKYEDTGFINDISVLRMEKPVALTDFVRPVCLPPPDLPIHTGRYCTVAGWGQLFEVGRIFPDTLQEVQLPLLSTEECRKRTVFFPLYRITDNMFCAGYERGGRDACLGDSGGPLMCQEDDGRWILAGVTSNGYGCARASRPGVYTKVSAYLSWVRSIMEDDNLLPSWKPTTCDGHRCPLGDCLPKSNICNGFMECSDGSDERNCSIIGASIENSTEPSSSLNS